MPFELRFINWGAGPCVTLNRHASCFYQEWLVRIHNGLEVTDMASNWMHMMDETGRTPLARAFASDHNVIAETMLRFEKEGPDTHRGATPLHRAALLGLHDALRTLLQFGADPNAHDQIGETALHKAVRSGSLAAVKELAGICDVNATDSMGMAPLHWAALMGRDDIAGVLLQNGADPNMGNDVLDGLTPARLAHAMGFDGLWALMARREKVLV